MSFSAIILAAGRGTRMKSARPKVLHEAAGWPLLRYPAEAARAAGADWIRFVVSPDTRDEVAAAVATWGWSDRVDLVVQEVPRGTGDAARVGLEGLPGTNVLVLCGDTPLVGEADLTPLCVLAAPGLRFLACELDDPTGYGRVLRSSAGRPLAIREHRDLPEEEQRRLREVNAGIYFGTSDLLREVISQLKPNNQQGELYLTDAVELLAPRQCVETVRGSASTLVGVNTREQLAQVEQQLWARNASRLRAAGASIPLGTAVDSSVQTEEDVKVESGAVLQGETTLGRGVTIGAGAVLRDVTVGVGATIGSLAVLEQLCVPAGGRVAPHGTAAL